MPNLLAFLALAGWPLISLLLFRKLETGRAVIWSLLLAYLFLPPPPAAFDFPLMPALSKQTLPPVVAFVLVFIMRRGELRFFPRSNVVRILMLVFMLSPFATVLTNAEPVFFGRVGLPALRLLEAVALMVQQAMLLLPFVLAHNFLARREDQRDLLVALVGTGLVYSLLMLIEIRLSPQLNIWIYGYFQHVFEQTVRFGGFRPIVFLYHGLWVAFFALMVVVAAAALFRGSTGRMKSFSFGVMGYMWVVLLLCKSMAALLYSLALLPLVLFAGRVLQFRVAALLALLALAYPAMKGFDLVPSDWLVEQAASFDQDRAGSLKFRFDNEEILLERAALKPVFGWGSWGRNHILDPVSGRILTVTDGRWIITIGVFGWVGFIAEFGLLAWPLLVLANRSRELQEQGAVSLWLGPLALLLGFNLIDLLPNATITTLTFLVSGMALGYVERHMPHKQKQQRALRSMM